MSLFNLRKAILKMSLYKSKLLANLVLKFKLYNKNSDKMHNIFVIWMGPIPFQVLRCAVTLGIFDKLAEKEGQTLDQISASTGIPARSLDVCLKALQYLEIIVCIDGHYYNEPLNVLMFLQKHQHIFASRSVLEYMHHIVGPAFFYLENSVVHDEPHGLYNLYGKDANFYEAVSKDKNVMKYFDAFMKDVTNRNKDLVTSDPFFSKFNKVLDIGGSTGEIALSLAFYHSKLKVTVLDFPEVLSITMAKFKDKGMDKRLDTYAGEALKPLPSGYDCILFFHFFDIFSSDDNQLLLRNAYRALPSGGSVAIFTPVTYSDKKCMNDLFGLYFLCLAEGKGKFYPVEDIVRWIKKENFTNISVKELPSYEVFITANKS